jgi:hypothetical protein
MGHEGRLIPRLGGGDEIDGDEDVFLEQLRQAIAGVLAVEACDGRPMSSWFASNLPAAASASGVPAAAAMM